MILQETFVKFMAQNLIQNQIPPQFNPSQQIQTQNNPNYSPKPNKKQPNEYSDALHLNLSEQS